MAEWNNIVEANKLIGTTNIKGKDYAEVNQRVKAFRYVYPEGTITTEILSLDNGVCVIKATASNDGKILATGLAYEKEDSTFINKTSYIENCETSAVGRCLGLCGLGIDTSIASKEEVKTAIANQEKKQDNRDASQNALAMIKNAKSGDELKAILAKTGEGKYQSFKRAASEQLAKIIGACVDKCENIERLKQIEANAKCYDFLDINEGSELFAKIVNKSLELNNK